MLDEFVVKILDEYDGFKHKSTLSIDEAKVVMAQYALACLHDSKLAQEAFEVCLQQNHAGPVE